MISAWALASRARSPCSPARASWHDRITKRRSIQWYGFPAAAVLAVELILIAPKVRLIRTVIPFDVRSVLAEPVAAFVLSAAIVAAAGAWLPDVTALAVGAFASVGIFLAAAIRSDPAFVQQLVASLRRAPRNA